MIEDYLRNKYGEYLDGLDIYENKNSLRLPRIIVKKEFRGSGVGSKIMNDLITYADKNKQIITLTPSSDFGGNKNRLIQFYKSFGFKHNKGQYKSFEFNDSMIRYPKLNETMKPVIKQLLIEINVSFEKRKEITRNFINSTDEEKWNYIFKRGTKYHLNQEEYGNLSDNLKIKYINFRVSKGKELTDQEYDDAPDYIRFDYIKNSVIKEIYGLTPHQYSISPDNLKIEYIKLITTNFHKKGTPDKMYLLLEQYEDSNDKIKELYINLAIKNENKILPEVYEVMPWVSKIKYVKMKYNQSYFNNLTDQEQMDLEKDKEIKKNRKKELEKRKEWNRPLNENMKPVIKQLLREALNKTITCTKCGWHWKESESTKKDLYICHECGHDNTTKKESLNERLLTKEETDIRDVANFINFAKEFLGITDDVKIALAFERTPELTTTAYYGLDGKLVIYVKDRALVDICRSIAHELVHHKQKLDGRLVDAVKDGEDGSPIENEANAVAGVIIRKWGKLHPEIYI